MIDLDRFKEINDNYGHLEGDKLIIHMADIIRCEIRDKDYAFRYGGEEFLVILDGGMDVAERVAERIRARYESSHYEIDGREIVKSTSVGVVEYQPRDSFDVAIDLADKALYQAKNAGRNQVICSTAHQATPHFDNELHASTAN